MYEAENNAALSCCSPTSTTVTGLSDMSQQSVLFQGERGKLTKGKEIFHLCHGDENNFVMYCFACLY